MTISLLPSEHRDLLLDVFTRITEDACLLGLSPVGVHLRPYSVDVQFAGEDTAAVDQLADAYELPAEPGTSSNYTRQARVEIADHEIELTIYTGRPPHLCATCGNAVSA